MGAFCSIISFNKRRDSQSIRGSNLGRKKYHANVVQQSYILKNYTYGKALGEGGSSSVLECTEKSTKNKYAIKVLSRKQSRNKYLFQMETDILVAMSHPNIIKFFVAFEDPSNLYILTELCSGGELLDRILDTSHPITEKHACHLVKTMLLSLQHCHQRNIVHRDIKPENFVFKTTDVNSEMVLIDFGCAKFVNDIKVYKDLAGTPYYLAPESAVGDNYVRTGRVLKASDL